MNKKQIKRVYNAVVILLLVGCLAYVGSRFMHWGDVEWTDDAQVHRHIAPVNTRVQGFIKKVCFTDYQHVSQGDTLVIIEDAEYRLQLAKALAGYRGTRTGSQIVSAGMSTTASRVDVASAGIAEAKANMDNAKRELDRYEALLAKDAVTRQQYDDVHTRYLSAVARYEQASQQRKAASLVSNEQAQQLNQNTQNVSVAEAAVNLARLNLSYTVITAPCDGVMGRNDLQVGQLVQPGQLLASVVSDSRLWVVANYRETQMRHIAVGSKVTFTVDAIGGVEYQGVVQSISPGTGASFSSAPVDNATGNFVKVEQRVPVRIVLTSANSKEAVSRLKAGLNVETTVKY